MSGTVQPRLNDVFVASGNDQLNAPFEHKKMKILAHLGPAILQPQQLLNQAERVYPMQPYPASLLDSASLLIGIYAHVFDSFRWSLHPTYFATGKNILNDHCSLPIYCNTGNNQKLTISMQWQLHATSTITKTEVPEQVGKRLVMGPSKRTCFRPHLICSMPVQQRCKFLGQMREKT